MVDKKTKYGIRESYDLSKSTLDNFYFYLQNKISCCDPTG